MSWTGPRAVVCTLTGVRQCNYAVAKPCLVVHEGKRTRDEGGGVYLKMKVGILRVRNLCV